MNEPTDDDILNSQVYVGSDGTIYDVYRLVKWIEQAKQPTRLSVDKLSREEFSDPTRVSVEPDNSEEFKLHAMSTKDYPIIVMKEDNKKCVMDGRHRLWKAKQQGKKTIKSYVVDKNEIPDAILETNYFGDCD